MKKYIFKKNNILHKKLWLTNLFVSPDSVKLSSFTQLHANKVLSLSCHFDLVNPILYFSFRWVLKNVLGRLFSTF